MASTGDLEVMVLQATRLRDRELFGRQDPKVFLELSGQKYSTKTKTDAGKNPVWNERFRFVQINPSYATELTVRVVDHNVMSSDTEIGHARVPLSRIYASRASEELRVPLVTAKGKTAGELALLLTYRPYTQAAPTAHHAAVGMAAPPPAYVAAPVPGMYAAAPAPAFGSPNFYSSAPMQQQQPAYGYVPTAPAPGVQYAPPAAAYPGGYAAPGGYVPQSYPPTYPPASYYPTAF